MIIFYKLIQLPPNARKAVTQFGKPIGFPAPSGQTWGGGLKLL